MLQEKSSNHWRFLVILMFLCTLLQIVESSNPSPSRNNTTRCSTKYAKQNAETLEIFWINLDESVNRRNAMLQMMKSLALENQFRIPAVTPQSIHFPSSLREGFACRSLPSANQSIEVEKAQALQSSSRFNRASAPRFLVSSYCGEASSEGPPIELATTLSHLYAVYKAIHRKGGRGADYALILEDDISLAFEIDFAELIASAPKDFGILQLVTSNIEVFNRAWGNYSKDSTKKWVLRERASEAWCAAAYIINKQRVKKALSAFFRKETANTFSIRVEQPCDAQSPCCTPEDRRNPSEWCRFIFSTYKMADFFLFNLIPDGTYISALPLFGPLDGAMKSTLHQEKVARHILVWENLWKHSQEMIRNPSFTPVYVNPQCSLKNPIEKYLTTDKKSSSSSGIWSNIFRYFGIP